MIRYVIPHPYQAIKQVAFIILFLGMAFQVIAQFWTARDASFPISLRGERVYAINDSIAWTYGIHGANGVPTYLHTTISKTLNKGVSWYNVIFPDPDFCYITSLWAIDYDTAWVTLIHYPNGSGAAGINRLYKTTDGGFHWDTLSIPITRFINFIYMWNSQEGIIVGDPDASGFEIFKTYNGGDSWEKIIVVPPAQDEEFLDRDNYVVIGDQIWFASSSGRIFFSPSRGEYWSVHEAPEPDLFSDRMGANAAGDIFLICWSYDDVAQDYVSKLWRRDEETAEWSIISHNSFNGLFDIEAVPGTNALVLTEVGDLDTWTTRLSVDRGDHWTTVDTTDLVSYLSFISPETGYAVQRQYFSDTRKTKVFRYVGGPLTGLFLQAPLTGVEVEIHPNPASDQAIVFVSGDIAKMYWLMVHDLNGLVWWRKELPAALSHTFNIDLSSWPAGVYTITLANAEGVLTEKIVHTK